MNELHELFCHGCNRYVQFELDMKKDGCHTLDCPNCGHKHYRVIKDGKITGERWAIHVLQHTVGGTSSTSTTSIWNLCSTGANTTGGTCTDSGGSPVMWAF